MPEASATQNSATQNCATQNRVGTPESTPFIAS